MQVERLRLAGFKSFVEPTELTIEPGLTGIVGPNGCGKSNLVEALRWVMGEASARRLRGGEMDDVIFAGSASRPARNLAEVALVVDNSARAAPFVYKESATIEVVRRIARGGGSSFRINGREARGRDVQLLFADGATGPHSGALVGQGRIGALIAAKPSERRLLLDEAAGTAGLHARRHEAELKLQAAEANLARLDDVIATLTAQIETLRKQARQAARYRRVGEEIRGIETQLLQARWQEAAAAAETAAAELRACERELAAATAAALGEERVRAEAEAALPPLRLAQAAAAAAVQRNAHAREALEAELCRVLAAQAEAEQRRIQLAADLKREAEHLADAEAALARLSDERQALEDADAKAAEAGADAAAAVDEALAELAAAEAGLQQMTEACAAGEARRTALERQCRDLAERHGRLQVRMAEAEQQRQSLLAAIMPPEAIEAAAAAVSAAAGRIDSTRAAAAAAAETLRACQDGDRLAADTARDGDRVLTGLRAEAEALKRVLAPVVAAATDGPPMLSLLQVTPGFEAAAAALFDGELAAPLLPEAQPDAMPGTGWVELTPLTAPSPPEGAQPLAGAIGAPSALARRLSHSFWVDNQDDGWRLQPRLQAGERLVDREGHLWRWDGFTRANAASGATAEHLRQHNRLAQLSGEIADAEADAARCRDAASVARAAREAATETERQAVFALRAAEEDLGRARAAEAELARRRMAAETRLAAVGETIDRLAGDAAEAASQREAAERALALQPDPALARTALAASRAQTTAARRRDSEARSVVDRLAAETAARHRRLAAISSEAASWRRRHDSAAAQHAALNERQAGLDGEIAELAARPAAIAGQSETLAVGAAAAAAEQRDAEDRLAAAETRLRLAAEAAHRGADAATAAREQRARLEARREAAVAALVPLRDEIAERFGQAIEAAAAPSAVGIDKIVAEDLGLRLERLRREREAMGPVNLLAEREAAEAEARRDELVRERSDLTEAIARLRRGIAALDREGRERVRAAFDALNRHFGELFERLFGGGRGELAWAGGDDPLVAGLDIRARPPGKRLETLSLLSGGEQALTAIALIFAVFLTNPAPICVLDEVDAPLDDANVDGFCRLVAEIADSTATRFLLITHHRVTMARMDRLFGVTMAERGVSQLVSVDLARAAELRQSA